LRRARSGALARARRRSLGYTMIEVLMGMAVLAVGASGVLALQKITIFGVTNGRAINAATVVGASHIEA
jgi:type IV pilus assembly protein PilV